MAVGVPRRVQRWGDADSGKIWTADGEELSKTGLKITLNEPKTSALVYIERI